MKLFASMLNDYHFECRELAPLIVGRIKKTEQLHILMALWSHRARVDFMTRYQSFGVAWVKDQIGETPSIPSDDSPRIVVRLCLENCIGRDDNQLVAFSSCQAGIQ